MKFRENKTNTSEEYSVSGPSIRGHANANTYHHDLEAISNITGVTFNLGQLNV